MRNKQRKLQQTLENIDRKAQLAEKSKRDEVAKHMEKKQRLAELTSQNKEKIEEKHNRKMEQLMNRMDREEQQYENMKKQLIEATKERGPNQARDQEKYNRIQKVKQEREKIYQNRKENLLLKLHHKEEIINQNEKEKKLKTEILKEINDFKQKRKEIHKEKFKKELEMRQEEMVNKLKAEKEKQEAYEKQKEIVLEHKYTNQLIDQMKIHYFKELHFNMKVKNEIGTKEFDKMAKNLKSIPDEDCQEDDTSLPDRNKLKKRISSAFGFAMSQFKPASTIKPIRSSKNLAITSRGHDTSRKSKRGGTRGGSVANSKIHKAYSNKALLPPKTTQAKPSKKIRPTDEAKEARGIFITGISQKNDDNDTQNGQGDDGSEHASNKAEMRSTKNGDNKQPNEVNETTAQAKDTKPEHTVKQGDGKGSNSNNNIPITTPDRTAADTAPKAGGR